MDWTTLRYSRNQINKAGETLASDCNDLERVEEAVKILNNWRSSHSYALNAFQIGLRRKVRSVSGTKHILVAQRLKRASSIVAKLRRFPNMKLSTMQDIAGCRAVLRSKAEAVRLKWDYYHSQLNHELINEKNYIEQPKESGYRSIHLVYRYDSHKKREHCGRVVEVQIRSRMQHAWATAVETVGTFLDQSLKSSQGSTNWLRFFALASSAFALDEKSSLVPNTPVGISELFEEINFLGKELEVKNKLSLYGSTLHITQQPELKHSHYFLLTLYPADGSLKILAYTKHQLDQANEDYLRQEKEIAGHPGAEAVLVAVDSLEALRKAYPNYYLDTQAFFSELKRIASANLIKLFI